MKARITALTLLTATAILAVSAQQARQDEVQQLPAAEADSGTPATFWWGDCDGDGLLDAYALAPGGKGLLLRNQGDGSFEDATLSAGLAGIEAPTAAAWGDFDGDGDLDLFLGTAFGQARLMRGLGDGSFEGAHVGIDHLGWDQRAAWIDYDSDGHLDLQVRTKERDLLYHNLGRGLFEPVDLGLPGIASLLGELCADPAPDAAEVETGSPARPVQPAAGAPPATTGSRTPVAPGPGTAAARGPGLGGSTPLGPHTPGMPAPTCMDSIMDQANPLNCVNASSIPTFGMLYPLGNEFNIDASGHVGVGTTSPAAQLHVFGSPVTIQANNSNGGGVAVRAVGAGAFGFGVKAEASYESGTGIHGAHTATTGTQPGVHGVTSSTAVGAAAVLGQADGMPATMTYGVRGSTSSLQGAGVLGEAQAFFGGSSAGVLGRTWNAAGSGVHGEVLYTAGYGWGVEGSSTGTTAGGGVLGTGFTGVEGQGEDIGVRGVSSASFGDAYGVHGSTSSAEGAGVFGGGPVTGVLGRGAWEGVRGEATNASGLGDGVVGATWSATGNGVVGHTISTTGENRGVWGLTSSPEGIGVFGEHEPDAGTAPGVYGITYSNDAEAAAVLGEALGSTGAGYGVMGSSPSPDGTGVYGVHPAATGTDPGVLGATLSNTPGAVAIRGEARSSTAAGTGVLGTSPSPQGTGVRGEHPAATGARPGVHGITSSTESGAAGVLGEATVHTEWGSGYGVIGRTWGNWEGAGVLGEVMHSSWPSSPPGVLGISEVDAWGVGGEFRGAGKGVVGKATGSSADYGGYFTASSSSASGAGVFGEGESCGAFGRAAASGGTGVKGLSYRPDATGVLGWVMSSTGDTIGVHGVTETGDSDAVGVLGEYTGTASVDATGVLGISTPAPYYGVGGSFEGGWRGVAGYATAAGYGSRYAGIFSATGGEGIIFGVYATADDPQNDGDARALYASASASDGFAGSFAGNVEVTGTLSKGGGSFKIDHPLDPENKYLYHSFVESPDMKNVYDGTVRLDGSGTAWVEMPEWCEALNRDFRYQLTAVGAPAPNLFVAERIANNRFRIAGGPSHAEVCWQVTGIRQDPFAEANRIPVEEDKRPEDRGLYLHPEARGLGREQSVDWARHHAPALEREAALRESRAEAQVRRRERVSLPPDPSEANRPERGSESGDR